MQSPVFLKKELTGVLCCSTYGAGAGYRDSPFESKCIINIYLTKKLWKLHKKDAKIHTAYSKLLMEAAGYLDFSTVKILTINGILTL